MLLAMPTRVSWFVRSVGKGLDQPVRDARRSAGRLIFLCGNHDHGHLIIIFLLADGTAHFHAVDIRRATNICPRNAVGPLLP